MRVEHIRLTSINDQVIEPSGAVFCMMIWLGEYLLLLLLKEIEVIHKRKFRRIMCGGQSGFNSLFFLSQVY